MVIRKKIRFTIIDWFYWHINQSGYFCGKTLGNRLHCSFVFTFCVVLKEFFHTFIWSQVFLSDRNNLQITIWPIDRTLNDITTPGQSGSWRNGNDRGLYTPQCLRIGCSLIDSKHTHSLSFFFFFFDRVLKPSVENKIKEQDRKWFIVSFLISDCYIYI